MFEITQNFCCGREFFDGAFPGIAREERALFDIKT
jgi:hypothetical protein